MKYHVRIVLTAGYEMVVEASSEEEARDKAYTEFQHLSDANFYDVAANGNFSIDEVTPVEDT